MRWRDTNEANISAGESPYDPRRVNSSILVSGRCEWDQILIPKKVPLAYNCTHKKSNGRVEKPPPPQKKKIILHIKNQENLR